LLRRQGYKCLAGLTSHLRLRYIEKLSVISPCGGGAISTTISLLGGVV
jgi:hypothetical protein